MTVERMRDEIQFKASIAPFIQMEKKGIITKEELGVIVTIMTEKYRPIFVHYLVSK